MSRSMVFCVSVQLLCGMFVFIGQIVCIFYAKLEHWPLTLPILLRFQIAMQVLE
jgi:hypothetical protein